MKKTPDPISSVAACALFFAVMFSACGKKGPPLAPFSTLPAAISSLTAKRVGAQVVLRVTVPNANVDGRQPADLDHVEVYADAIRRVRPADYLTRGVVIGSIKVRRPPQDGETPGPAAANAEGVDQGTPVTIVDTLEESLPASEGPPAPAQLEPEEPFLFPGGGGPLLSPRQSAAPSRYYVAVGVNRRGRKGPPSAVAEVPLVPPPPPPRDLKIDYTEKSLSVSWEPPLVPLARPIQEASPGEGALASRPVISFAGPSGYNVYDAPKGPGSGRDGGLVPPALTPLNQAVLTKTSYEETRVEFGVERCFVVRSQETKGAVTIESGPSETVCRTPIDTFAPAAPRSVAAVASEGAIDLIWEANSERDLAGYLILRGEAPGEKLQALTKTPITDTTYRDTTVRPGVMYVYAVVAVDNANNISEQSDRVEQRAQ